MDNSNFNLSRGRGLPKGIGWGVAALVVIFIGSAIFFFGGTSERASWEFAEDLERFQMGIADLKALDTQAAREKFSEAEKEAPQALGDLWGRVSALFGGAREFLFGFGDIASRGLVLVEDLDFLLTKGLNLFLSGHGEELIPKLESVGTSLKAIGEENAKFSEAASKVLGTGSEASEELSFYLPLSLEISRLEKFFAALLPWLKADESHRIVLMLQNSSELRPAGGFLGSYGVLKIKNAGLDGVDVHDVRDADNLLFSKVVPPKPLQLVARDWGVAGANWFFDFSLSAGKTLELLEASDLYSKESIKFDGAVAVSPTVLGDVLRLVGPIELKEAKITLDAENFLVALQRQVELSREKRATYPKNVLRELMPGLIARLSALDGDKARELFALVGQWVKERDLMFYFRNADFMNFADFYEATGKVYELPRGFNGDYLAVVNANVDGGKTDLFMRETVSLSSQINADGTVSNHLVISRAHEGNKAPYAFYKIPNQTYVQVFVPEGSRLTNFKGGIEKKIAQPINYKKQGYLEDLPLVEIESTVEKSLSYPAVESHEESSRKVFSTWSRVTSGGKAELVFDYVHRLAVAPADEVKYQFIFEKQPGTNRNYKFEINAPVGFRFRDVSRGDGVVLREYGLPVFTHESGGSPGRLFLDLTLERI